MVTYSKQFTMYCISRLHVTATTDSRSVLQFGGVKSFEVVAEQIEIETEIEDDKIVFTLMETSMLVPHKEGIPLTWP